jgi:hypothetical protein
MHTTINRPIAAERMARYQREAGESRLAAKVDRRRNETVSGLAADLIARLGVVIVLASERMQRARGTRVDIAVR